MKATDKLSDASDHAKPAPSIADVIATMNDGQSRRLKASATEPTGPVVKTPIDLDEDEEFEDIPDELTEFALELALLEDRLRAERAKLSDLKSELQEQMDGLGIEVIPLPDRKAPIKFVIGQTKRTTLKGLKTVLGEKRGKDVWNLLPTNNYRRLCFPKPISDEPPE